MPHSYAADFAIGVTIFIVGLLFGVWLEYCSRPSCSHVWTLWEAEEYKLTEPANPNKQVGVYLLQSRRCSVCGFTEQWGEITKP